MALKHGNPSGTGGKRKGAGRKPDWFKAKCQKIGTSAKAIEFLRSVIEGDPVEEKKLFGVNDKPITVWESASVDARVRAWNSVMDRGFGKAAQGIELSGQGGEPFSINLISYGPKP